MNNKIKNIIFDFDGVIIDSMPVREYGFRKIFSSYDNKLVDKLVYFHNENGGLSRFVKIKYFYNNILKKEISENEINEYANEFSLIMRKKLLSKDLIISETLDFIKMNYKNINMSIASGSEEKELIFLNDGLKLTQFFQKICGSPTIKIENVSNIIKQNKYKKEDTVLIGDSINDYEAAKENKIRFFGYNNIELKEVSDYYITSFKKFKT